MSTPFPIILLLLSVGWITAQSWVALDTKCPQFSYGLKRSSTVTPIGVITAPETSNTTFWWRAQFTFPGEIEHSASISNFRWFPNKTMAAANMVAGKPAEVYVQFKNFTTILPVMTLLELNGERLCSLQRNDTRYTLVTLTRRLSYRSLYKVKQQF